jgi:hypothetical protein
VSTGTAVAIIGLALAWLLYRLERAATRGREIKAARAVLVGVHRGMVDGLGEEPGWGERYFATNYSDAAALGVALDTGNAVRKGSYQQVLVVPTAPLEALIASGYAGDLITEPTVYYANLGLWHLAVFNQLVEQQTALVGQHLVEIKDPDLAAEQRERIATAVTAQAHMLHRRGVGEPFTEEGWYRRLKDAVACDITRLDRQLRQKWYPVGEARLAVGDAAAAIATLVVVGILVAAN